jgi:hypothetical protein
MEYANAKDIKRAKDLGVHSGVINLQAREIARGKASSMSQAITDKKKILGRLEAIASEWNDYQILKPFIDKCCELWPGSQYTHARDFGSKTGRYCKLYIIGGRNTGYGGLSIDRKFIEDKVNLNDNRGVTLTGEPYEYDSVARIIFNIMLLRNMKW